MTKNKKLTYKQIETYVGALENKYNHAMNTIGQTISDFIEYKGDKENFIEFLKEKYKQKEAKEKTTTGS